jgi:hypothetical protein
MIELMEHRAQGGTVIASGEPVSRTRNFIPSPIESF